MPSEPEILKLKKEIHFLREHNAELSQDNKECLEKIGALQRELLNIKNKSLLLEEARLVQNKETLRVNIEEAVLQEREKMQKLQEENENLLSRIKLYETREKENEIFIQKLQIENNSIKKQLIDFGKKHEATNFIKEIRMRDDQVLKKEQDYQRIVVEWNELRDQMENVLDENRVLRQIADVPENYGIDIQKIRMGDRLKVEDYKAKIKLLKKEVDDLETERAQLKHRLIYLANTLQIPEQPFVDLTPEQKVEVSRFAQSLVEGTQMITPEVYDLKKEIQALKIKIQILQEQNLGVRNDSGFHYTGKDKNQMSEFAQMFKDENAELKQLLKDNLNKFNNAIEGLDGRHYDMSDHGGLYHTTKGFFKKPSLGGTGEFSSPSGYDEFGYLQLPAIPLINEKNIDNTKFANSYRFNTKFRIDPTQVHQLFGVSLDETDPDALKRESAALQAQMIELLEIEKRRNENDVVLNENLGKIYNKFETLVLIQNEIFDRYMADKKRIKDDNENFNKQKNDLIAQVDNLSRINKSYEKTIALFEKKTTNDLEIKNIERMKENAILETSLMKLQRKYDCLVEDEKRLRDYVTLSEKNNIEKDTAMKSTIAKLKGWKSMLAYYVKFVNNKLKKSIDKNEFDRVLNENKYLRSKNNELNIREVSIIKEMSISQTLRMKYKELENDFFEMEEMKLDAEIELNMLKKRVQEKDPDYFVEQRAFRKLSQRIAELKLSYEDLIRTFTGVQHSSSEQEKKASLLSGLNLTNSTITKADFEQCLTKLNITEAYLNSTDRAMIYRVLNCDDDDKIDVRLLIKKLEQIGVSDIDSQNKDNELLTQFIEKVRTSTTSLYNTFAYFDNNNNGCITREEFKFALQHLNFPLNEENINKLVLLVKGNNANIGKLDHTDTFNYIEFCDLFEQKAKNYLLARKKNNINKNMIKIDWRFNALSSIVVAMKAANVTTTTAFVSLDRTTPEFLTFEEFNMFIQSVNALISHSDASKLFNSFDPSNKGMISIQALTVALDSTEKQIQAYNKVTGVIESGNSLVIDIHKKYSLLIEDKNHLEQKQQRLQNKVISLESENELLQNQITEYVKKDQELISKYYEILNENQKIKDTYDVNRGVTREDLRKVEDLNETLTREVTILRVGINTFKDLYNASQRQVKEVSLLNEKRIDEVDTFKRAVRELQSENNQNALIGKLYYTILISRWREANTLRRYDDFVSDFSAMKEDNFQLETHNKTLTKDLCEMQVELHDKIVENIRMSDLLENYQSGIVVINTDKRERHPYDEMRKLIKALSDEKGDLVEKIISLKKKILRVENENDALNSQVFYAKRIVEEVKSENSDDENMMKMIAYCDEISKLKLENGTTKRENNFRKENEEYLQKLNGQLNDNVKDLEKGNIEWENKYRKMEEVYRAKDNERMKKIIASLEKMKLYSTDEINYIIKNGVDSNVRARKVKKEDEPSIEEYKTKIAQLNNVITLKNNKINELSRLVSENNELRNQTREINVNIPDLVGETGYGLIKDDETKLIAQTAHKTIKTLQDLLSQKNALLAQKESQLEKQREEYSNMKSQYIQRMQILEDENRKDHDNTMRKLSNIIDTTNRNIVVKYSHDDLSLMTLDDIQKMLIDKDSAIKALGIELNAVKDENLVNYEQITVKNRKIAELEHELKVKDLEKGQKVRLEEVEKMKRIYEEKCRMIDAEKEKIQKLKNDFAKQYEDRAFSSQANFGMKDDLLDKTAHVPERLIVNKEKSGLYNTIEQLQKDKKKLKDEKKALTKKIEEVEKEKNDLVAKLNNARNDVNRHISLQVKDTKTISSLRKDKEKLKASNDQLKEEAERLKKQLDELNSKNSNSLNASSTYKPRRQAPKTQSQQRDIRPSNLNKMSKDSLPQISNQMIDKPKPTIDEGVGGDIIYRPDEDNLDKDMVRKLVYFCIKKNINMNQQLVRYDLSKNGKVSTADFRKAIDELKLGFIDYDLDLLVKAVNPVDDIIVIKDFVELLKNKDPNYKAFMEDQEKKEALHKQASRKYNPFENKNYNINY